mgnify:FL=1
MTATKKATIAVVANQKHRPNYNTKNLFGLSRKKWSRILDVLDKVEGIIVLSAFGVLFVLSWFLAFFGRCL